MAFGIEVADQYGVLTDITTRTARFVSSLTIPQNSTSTYTASVAGVSYDGEVFVYFEPLADTNQNHQGLNSTQPSWSVSGNTVSITANGTGGVCYIGVT